MNWRKSSCNLLLACALLLLGACKKEEAQVAQEPELTKYEMISGNYKVYDTSGTFLYKMNINFLQGAIDNGIPKDTIVFTNLDGEFNFIQPQGYNPSNPSLYVRIGTIDTLFDANGKRWKILPFALDQEYSNTFKDDTIKMKFHKTNINYWIQDAVPFEECYCKQIAVKQY